MSPEERIQHLKSFLEIDPNDSFTRFAIAQEYGKLEDWARVLDIYERLRESDPNYIGVYYHLGKLYQMLGRSSDAERVFSEGIGEANKQGDQHSKSELQGALMEVQGIGWD